MFVCTRTHLFSDAGFVAATVENVLRLAASNIRCDSSSKGAFAANSRGERVCNIGEWELFFLQLFLLSCLCSGLSGFGVLRDMADAATAAAATVDEFFSANEQAQDFLQTCVRRGFNK